MKNIINITIIILCTCIFYGCKKKDKPHGANIVRYKLNGVEKKIEGNYSSFSLEGILKIFQLIKEVLLHILMMVDSQF
jgi:hypothetical protein